MMEWQPIETAPTDDQCHVLLYGNGSNFTKCVFVGYWDSVLDEWKTFDGVGAVPTHWMPLPFAPSPEEE